MTDEIEDLLDTLEAACRHPWIVNRQSWNQGVRLVDPDGDGVGYLEAAETLTAIRQIREALDAKPIDLDPYIEAIVHDSSPARIREVLRAVANGGEYR